MKKINTDRLYETGLVCALLLLFYYMIAAVRFSIVHPYATQMQKVMHFKDIITWKKVPAKEFIPHD